MNSRRKTARPKHNRYRSRIAENLVTQAVNKGKFDRLPGKGKPLDLDSYSPKAAKMPMNVEQKIAEAVRKGEFENLPGEGKPLDLDSYFRIPEHSRMAFHILRNAGYAPVETELLKEIRALKEKRKTATDENERRRLSREINTKTLSYDIARGRYYE